MPQFYRKTVREVHNPELLVPNTTREVLQDQVRQLSAELKTDWSAAQMAIHDFEHGHGGSGKH